MSEGLLAPSRYCQFYCEENIWRLCADARFEGREPSALLISNRDRRVAMWGQRISPNPELPIVWDYHVVLLARARANTWETRETWEIWDLDGVAPPPQPALAWLDASFRGAGVVPPAFEPRFRRIQGSAYRRCLRSDRRHMRRPDGAWRHPPPSWEPIRGERDEGGSNLDRFLDMEDEAFLGEVFDLRGLRGWLNKPATRAEPSTPRA